jgi:Uma2 family endonuclease
MEAEKFVLYTVEDYLEAEKLREVHHEYPDGTVHAMSGGTLRHNDIAVSIASIFRRLFRGGPCRVNLADVKVRARTAFGEAFYHPDVVVACDPNDQREFFLENPTIIFEVLSPSTESVDQREKRFAYQTIPSLAHYVLVAQHAVLVEWFRREGDGWTRLLLTLAEDALDFPERGVTMTLSEVYEGIAFD